MPRSRSGLLPSLALLAASALSQAQTTVRDLIYLKSGGAAFTMDEYKPARPTGAAVLWLVSGGWFSSHEGIRPELAKPFTDRGITVFEVVHGGQPRYKIPEIETQILRAVRYVRANAATLGVDPARLGIAGGSAGGHLSLMVGGLGREGDPSAKDPVERASSRVQAIVAYFPPVDFLNFGGPGVMPFDAPQMAVFLPAFGVDPKGPKERIAAVARAVSPIYLVTPTFPPTFLIHGDKDPLVPIEQSRRFDEALAKAGVAHRLLVVPGEGHGTPGFAPTMKDAAEWFAARLTAK